MDALPSEGRYSGAHAATNRQFSQLTAAVQLSRLPERVPSSRESQVIRLARRIDQVSVGAPSSCLCHTSLATFMASRVDGAPT